MDFKTFPKFQNFGKVDQEGFWIIPKSCGGI